jgi:hypothetical protein
VQIAKPTVTALDDDGALAMFEHLDQHLAGLGVGDDVLRTICSAWR